MRTGRLVVTRGRVTLEGGIVVIGARFGSYRQQQLTVYGSRTSSRNDRRSTEWPKSRTEWPDNRTEWPDDRTEVRTPSFRARDGQLKA
jgi:hypothetical protein